MKIINYISINKSNVWDKTDIAWYSYKKPVTDAWLEDKFTFYIERSDIIQFKSQRTFKNLGSRVEEGHLKIVWDHWGFKINNLHKNPPHYKYPYSIPLPEGTIHLTEAAFIHLTATIKEELRSIISEKMTSSLELLSFLQTSWLDFPDTFEKVQFFSKTQAFSIFIDTDALAAFESNFYRKWVSISNDQYKHSLIFQTDLKRISSNGFFTKNPLAKFDALVRLVAIDCNWEERYAAIRTYGAILTSVKNEGKEQCNITYNFKIKSDWEYEDCLKNYITCVKELYKDPNCFGCFVYYLMLEEKISLPPRFERTPEHLGFQYAYEKVKRDISLFAKEFFDNLEVLQLKKELSRDNDCSIATVEDYDLMSGQEFERAISEIFKNMGYLVTLTPSTGDQGIDIIAVRNGTRIGIQTKCYTGKVGNSAVQEVVAGKDYYSVNRCMVVTNSTFTSAAIELARANNVILWDRYILEEKLLSSNFHESD